MATRIVKSFTFDAAHRLPQVAAEHKCGRVHGHTYVVDIAIEADPDPDMGWIMDFGEISSAFGPLLEEMDHRLLNEIPGLDNPTAELMARWIFERLQPALPLLTEVIVHEAPTTAASYQP